VAETCSYLVNLIHNIYLLYLVVLQTAPFLLISFAYTTGMTYPKITDHIFCIRHILENKREYNEAVHQLFVDFKKAYDSVRREVL